MSREKTARLLSIEIKYLLTKCPTVEYKEYSITTTFKNVLGLRCY